MNSKLSASILFLFAFIVLSCTVSCDNSPKTDAGLKEQIRLQKEEIKRLNQTIEKQEKEHNDDIQKLKEQHKTEVDSLKGLLEEYKNSNNQNHIVEINKINELHAKELESLEDNYKIRLAGSQEVNNKLQEEINKQNEKIQALENDNQIDQMTQNMINRLPIRYQIYLWVCISIFGIFVFVLFVFLWHFISKYYALKDQLLSSINSNIQQLKEYE